MPTHIAIIPENPTGSINLHYIATKFTEIQEHGGEKFESKRTYRREATSAEGLGRRRNFDDFIRVNVFMISVSLFLSATYLKHLQRNTTMAAENRK